MGYTESFGASAIANLRTLTLWGGLCGVLPQNILSLLHLY